MKRSFRWQYDAPEDDCAFAEALERVLAGDPAAADRFLSSDPARREDLNALVNLAGALEASRTTVAPRPAFRAGARARLFQHMEQARPSTWQRLLGAPSAARPWALRAAAGVAALSMTGFATLSASASALPGDPLYGVKGAREELALQFATSDDARVEALLSRADARLDETSRLVGLGRVDDAARTAEQYDETLARATQTLSRLAVQAAEDGADVPGSADQDKVESLEAKLKEHQAKLDAVIADAPQAALNGLERAREVSGHGLTRAAEVHATATPGAVVADGARESGQQRGLGRGGQAIVEGSSATPTPRATATPETEPAETVAAPGQRQDRREDRPTPPGQQRQTDQGDDTSVTNAGRGTPVEHAEAAPTARPSEDQRSTGGSPVPTVRATPSPQTGDRQRSGSQGEDDRRESDDRSRDQQPGVSGAVPASKAEATPAPTSTPARSDDRKSSERRGTGQTGRDN